jgi:hypothetical protein
MKPVSIRMSQWRPDPKDGGGARGLAAHDVCVGEERWHNGRTGGSEILVQNVVLGTDVFMRTWDARIPSWPGFAPETGYVDADRRRQLKSRLQTGRAIRF